MTDEPTKRADEGAADNRASTQIRELVAACIEAIEAGETDPVERVCAHQPDLAARVRRRLLQLGARGLLQHAVVDVPLPTTIGPYTILAELGTGGMGTVYLAEQHEPVRRQVALKVIKLGMATQEVVARFAAERQALARMNHPGIAQVFDAGVTADGRPFFAMEYVPGESITRYCDARALRIEARLRVFAAVCRAVQHAHDQGIIHRDLKPSNMLISEHEGIAVPKIIDFGIAKATSEALASVQHTRTDQVLGTPEYMSPEQALSGGLDVDTRSDVYSLGVALYELLCGALPFDSARLRHSGRREMERILLEELPTSPSTRLAAGPVQLRAARGAKTTGTRHGVRGELDWIVLKALAKKREDRYPSPLALAEDLERYLRHEPVLAGPPAFGYRLRKFVRRHRAPVAAAVVALCALVTGLVVSLHATATAVAAQNQEAAALADMRAFYGFARDAVGNLVEVADQRLADVPRADGIRQTMLTDALRFYEGLRARQPTDPDLQLEILSAQERAGTIQQQLGRVRDAVATFTRCLQALDGLVSTVPTQPGPQRLRALVRANLGTVLSNLGEAKAARDHRESAIAEFAAVRRLSGDPHDSLGLEAAIWNDLGLDAQDDPARALGCFDQALACLGRAIASKPQDGALPVLLARCHSNRGRMLSRLGREDEAVTATRDAISKLAQLQTVPGARDLRGPLATAHDQLATLYKRLDRLEAAGTEQEAANELLRQLVADHPDVSMHQDMLGGGLDLLAGLAQSAGDLPKARRLFGEAEAVRTKLAAEHPQHHGYQVRLARTLVNQGSALVDAWQRQQAEEADVVAVFQRAVAVIDPVQQAQPQDLEVGLTYAGCHGGLATVFDQAHRAEALPEHLAARRVLEALVAASPTLPELRLQLAYVLNNLTLSYLNAGDARAAVTAGEAGITEARAGHDLDAHDGRICRVLAQQAVRLAVAQQRLGDASGAVETAALVPGLESLPERMRAQGAMELAQVALEAEGQPERPRFLQRAEEQLRAAIQREAAMAERVPGDTALALDLRMQLADVLGGRDQVKEQLTVLDEALRLLADLPTPPPDRVRDVLGQCGEALLAAHDPKGAAARVEQLASRLPDDSKSQYVAAVLFARCASASAGEDAETLAARAVTCLRQALAKGFKPAGDLRNVAEFVVLKKRADFQTLLKRD